jgi:hypothetical protein
MAITRRVYVSLPADPWLPKNLTISKAESSRRFGRKGKRNVVIARATGSKIQTYLGGDIYAALANRTDIADRAHAVRVPRRNSGDERNATLNRREIRLTAARAELAEKSQRKRCLLRDRSAPSAASAVRSASLSSLSH